MPKSKRVKVVSLTQVKADSRNRKEKLIDNVREACEQYQTIYLFNCENMRAKQLKDLRIQFKNDSRFFYGKNKVMRVALGKTPEEAYMKNLDLLGEKLSGEVGLLFTNRDPKQLQKFFEKYSVIDYARAGFEVIECAEGKSKEVIKKGPLRQPGDVPFPSSMNEQLKGLRLPVNLNYGVLELEDDYVICKNGDILNPEQAQLLRLFGKPLAPFKIKLVSKWTNGKLTDIMETD